MAGETPATFYALTSANGINPPRHLVLQCPPGLGTLCGQVLWQKLKEEPSNLKGDICALPTREGKQGPG